MNAQFVGSERVSRLLLCEPGPTCELQIKVRDREHALASTRDARSPRIIA